MITRRTITDAVLALLSSGGAVVGDSVAPLSTATLYAVLEQPGGSRYDGTLGDPESAIAYRFRVRCVATDDDIAIARKAAEILAGNLATLVLDRSTPFTGAGWTCGRRVHLGSAGIDEQGPIVNAIDDYELLIVAT